MPQRIIDQQLCVPIQRSLCRLHSDIEKNDKTHEQKQCFDTEQQQISMKTHLVDVLRQKSWLPLSNFFLHHHLFLVSVIAASESLEVSFFSSLSGTSLWRIPSIFTRRRMVSGWSSMIVFLFSLSYIVVVHIDRSISLETMTSQDVATTMDNFIASLDYPWRTSLSASVGWVCVRVHWSIIVWKELRISTTDGQLLMRWSNSWKVQEHGDVVCNERVGCDSGVLCLDWREICDGVQQCMSGVDEENCDLLEMNRCEQDEYRCMNGMCISDEFFLDGEFDCLDWSDELQFKKDQNCTDETVSRECDDRVCPPNQWSCGDGPLPFQKQVASSACGSQRDHYFMCETRNVLKSWTIPNGRCHWNGPYNASAAVHDNEENLYEYLLKCALSFRGEVNCPYHWELGYGDRLAQQCHQPLVQYSRGAVIAPFMFFLYNRTRSPNSFLPALVVISGTLLLPILLRIDVTNGIRACSPLGWKIDGTTVSMKLMNSTRQRWRSREVALVFGVIVFIARSNKPPVWVSWH